MKRKLLSVLLAVVLVAGLPVSSAFADEVEEPTTEETTTVVTDVVPAAEEEVSAETTPPVSEEAVEGVLPLPTAPTDEEPVVSDHRPTPAGIEPVGASIDTLGSGLGSSGATVGTVTDLDPNDGVSPDPDATFTVTITPVRTDGGYGVAIDHYLKSGESSVPDAFMLGLYRGVVFSVIPPSNGYVLEDSSSTAVGTEMPLVEDEVVTGTFNFTFGDAAAPPVLSGAKDITSFEIGNASGTISGTNIGITVPYGTDVTGLTPTIEHSGTSISPNGAQDFSSPIQYTVTAEDTSTKVYTVTVTVAAPATTKEITEFTLAGQAATINGEGITVTVPYGTDVTALTPSITHNGVSISPSGSQDFSSPVTYTVTAQDGSTKAFAVTATVSTNVPVTASFGTWKGSGTTTAKAEADLSKFVRLELNGQTVDGANYSTASGSTIITLSESYLKTLANGSYAFTAVFTDGTAALPLTVDVKAEETTTPPPAGTINTGGGGLPQTGDSSLPILWAALLFISGGGLILFARRRFLLGSA